jgi:hypothetical protein
MIAQVRAALAALPDSRRPCNATKYEMIDAGLSAFSVFFTQSPSFLDWQIRMQQSEGTNNANSIFGVHQIPSDAQIRNLLDNVPPETLFPLIASIGDTLFNMGYLDTYRWICLLSLIIQRRVGKKHYTDTYRYASHLPLINSDDALLVNGCELVTTDADDKVNYRNGWATSHERCQKCRRNGSSRARALFKSKTRITTRSKQGVSF